MAVMKVHQMVWCLKACLHWFLLQGAYTVACHCPQHILSPLVGRSHHPPHKHVATAGDVVFDGHSVFSFKVDIGSSIGVIRMWTRFTTTTIISGRQEFYEMMLMVPTVASVWRPIHKNQSMSLTYTISGKVNMMIHEWARFKNDKEFKIQYLSCTSWQCT